jgi:hypothetical protein
MHLAATIPLLDLGPFVLGDDSLDLKEKLPLWGGVVGVVEENHLHARSCEFIYEQDLVGVCPSQTVGAEDVKAIKSTLGRSVAHALQGRPEQDRAADPFVDEAVIVIEGQSISLDPKTQGRHLAGDGLVAYLLVGGYAGVEGRACCIRYCHMFDLYDEEWRPEQ